MSKIAPFCSIRQLFQITDSECDLVDESLSNDPAEVDETLAIDVRIFCNCISYSCFLYSSCCMCSVQLKLWHCKNYLLNTSWINDCVK